MKMKSKIIILLLIAFSFSSQIVSAKSTTAAAKIGYAYESLSSRFIDSAYIPSYDVDGVVCVLVNDLAKYGFIIEWDGVNKIVRISDSETDVYTMTDPQVLKKLVDNSAKLNQFIPDACLGKNYLDDNTDVSKAIESGYRFKEDKKKQEAIKELTLKKAFDIFKTDIKVFYNNKEIRSYSTNERTLVPFDDIFKDAIAKQTSPGGLSFDFESKKNAERVAAYLLSQKKGDGIELYSYVENSADGTRTEKYTTERTSGLTSAKLYGNIFFDYNRTSRIGQFYNNSITGLFELRTISRQNTYIISNDCYVASGVGDDKNWKSNDLNTYSHLLYFDSESGENIVHSSGVYEDGKMKDGVEITFSIEPKEKNRTDESNLTRYNIKLYNIKDFVSSLYYVKTYELEDPSWYFTLY